MKRARESDQPPTTTTTTASTTERVIIILNRSLSAKVRTTCDNLTTSMNEFEDVIVPKLIENWIANQETPKTVPMVSVVEPVSNAIVTPAALPDMSSICGNRFHVYTDGSCFRNPGPGGYGFVVVLPHRDASTKPNKVYYSGFALSMTTNNQMELMAAIVALETVDNCLPITIHTDSQYVKLGIELWINKWKSNGWKTQDRKSVKNQVLWRRLDKLCTHSARSIEWNWVKGHGSCAENIAADQLAKSGADSANAYQRRNKELNVGVNEDGDIKTMLNKHLNLN